jgi:glycosyltransferase involved in cell wall biosynthesis
MAAMNICMLLQNIYDFDIRVRRKAEALASAGYMVDVLALRPPGSMYRDYILNGVNIHTFSLGKKRGSKGRYYFEYIAFFLWALIKASFGLGDKKYQVVDVNTLPDFLVFAACLLKRRGAHLILDMHEIFPEFLISKYGYGADHWQVRLARFLERASVDFADHVIVINDPIRHLLESRGLDSLKSTVIMNAVDETMFASSQRSKDVLIEMPSPGKFVLMYHGTITRIYGLEIALIAFSKVQSHIPEAIFWIIGDGPEKNYLKMLTKKLHLESKILFIDMVPPQDIPHYLRRCDVGILPTRRDVFLELSFSNKLSEFIILKKPVLASRLKTIRHYFSEEAITYFEPNSVSDLARQMVYIYRNKEIRMERAMRALQEYEPINWAVMKERYLKLIKDLASNARLTIMNKSA